MTNRHDWQPGASGCILRSWRNHTEEGFDLYRQAGIKYAELSVPVWTNAFEGLDFYDHPEKIYSIAQRSGVEFSSFHVPFSVEVSFSNPDAVARHAAAEIMKKTIRSAAEIGIKTMVIHPSGAHYEKYSDREFLVKQCIEHVGEIYEYCERVNVTLALENLTGRGVCGTPNEMLRFLHTYENLKVCFDTNHCELLYPEDYLDALLQAGMKGRIATLHVSDYNMGKEMHLMPGEGKINWEKVLSKLEQLDYSGVFMYEVTGNCEKKISYTPQMVADNFKEIISVGATKPR